MRLIETPMDDSDRGVSVVVSFNNEEGNVSSLYLDLKKILASTGKMYELIFVDDGSSDGTLKELIAIHEGDPDVVVIAFDRNYGQTAGFIAGINVARHGIVITMDGDWQHAPADILRLLEKITEGFNVVNTRKVFRKDNLLTRILPAIAVKGLISFLFRVGYRDINSGFRAYRAGILNEIAQHGEVLRFFPLLSWKNELRLAEIDITADLRRSGKTHFNFLNRFRRLIRDVQLLSIVSKKEAVMKEAALFYKVKRIYTQRENYEALH